jgi:glycogen debranching enzyme
VSTPGVPQRANGSVWPHDTAIAVAGLRRGGRPVEAVRLAQGLLAAASATGGELRSSSRASAEKRRPYRSATRLRADPQAWASGAPLLILRSLLGLDPDIPAGRVTLDPVLPLGQPG